MPVLQTRCCKRGRSFFTLLGIIVLMAGMLLPAGSLYAGNTSMHVFYRPSHVISAHLFGDASLISLQYEQVFAHQDMSFFTAGAGFGYQEEFFLNNIFTKDPPDKYLSIPHHLSFNYGGSNKFLELGIGGTLMSGNTSQNFFCLPPHRAAFSSGRVCRPLRTHLPGMAFVSGL